MHEFHLIKISLQFVPKVRINNISALVQKMAWFMPGDKPLSEPMITDACMRHSESNTEIIISGSCSISTSVNMDLDVIKVSEFIHFVIKSFNISKLTNTVEVLRKESVEKDKKITTLQRQVRELETKMDDYEEHGRRDSVRIFGLSEDSPGSTDEKVLRLCNKRMKLSPPRRLEEISISHRVGKLGEPAEDGTPPSPRPLLVKFATRRSKNRVISKRKNLRKPHADDSVGRMEGTVVG